MKQKIYTYIALFLFFSIKLSAQQSTVLPSAISAANISSAVQDEWSAFQNISALAHVENWEVGAQYENHFMVRELSTKSVQFAKSTKHVNIGASFSYFGYSLYNDMIAGIGFARNFGDKFSMGLQFDYFTSYFSGEEQNRYRGTIFPQFGVSSKITPNLIVGFNTFNPFQANIKTEYAIKRIPSIFSFGSNYFFSDKVNWLFQMDKEVSSNFKFATGFEYKMIEQMTVKIGAYDSEFLVPTLGVDFHLNRFHIYFNEELHPQLGLNSQLCLKYKY